MGDQPTSLASLAFSKKSPRGQQEEDWTKDEVAKGQFLVSSAEASSSLAEGREGRRTRYRTFRHRPGASLGGRRQRCQEQEQLHRQEHLPQPAGRSTAGLATAGTQGR